MGNTLFILAVIVYFIVNWISFPSYNIAISLIALHSGAQEETPEGTLLINSSFYNAINVVISRTEQDSKDLQSLACIYKYISVEM